MGEVLICLSQFHLAQIVAGTEGKQLHLATYQTRQPVKIYNIFNLWYNCCRNLGFELNSVCMNTFISVSVRAKTNNFGDNVSYYCTQEFRIRENKLLLKYWWVFVVIADQVMLNRKGISMEILLKFIIAKPLIRLYMKTHDSNFLTCFTFIIYKYIWSICKYIGLMG